jgi:hypothetical protein
MRMTTDFMAFMQFACRDKKRTGREQTEKNQTLGLVTGPQITSIHLYSTLACHLQGI